MINSPELLGLISFPVEDFPPSGDFTVPELN